MGRTLIKTTRKKIKGGHRITEYYQPKKGEKGKYFVKSKIVFTPYNKTKEGRAVKSKVESMRKEEAAKKRKKLVRAKQNRINKKF